MALWLEKEHGVAGLSERLEKLSVDYQTERSTLEGNDPTRIAPNIARDARRRVIHR